MNNEPVTVDCEMDKRDAFTIVELLIVIVIIGILAAITIVSYSGITRKATEAVIKADLNNAAKLILMEYSSTDQMPTSFPGSMKTSNNIGLSLASTGNNNSFCINAQTTNSSSPVYMHYSSTSGDVQPGSCTGSVIYGSEIGMPRNIVLDSSFSNIGLWSNWFTILNDPSGHTLTARSGTSSDPIENKPVLTITNNTAKTEPYAVIFGRVNYTDIVSGSDYKLSVWVRRIGPYVGDLRFVVRDSDGSYAVFADGCYLSSLDTSWQLCSFNDKALANSISTNGVYMTLTPSAFNTAGWSVEFQDPKIIKL